MTTILVTGSHGQLGNELQKIAGRYPELEFIFTDIDELDITCKGELFEFVQQKKYDFIINCASYTAVDKAEEEPKLAGMINGKAVKLLSEAANKNNISLVHISTDFVFNGNSNKPYIETDKPEPQSVYAKSKYEGEKYFLEIAQKGIIIRTSWLYSEFGNNFVKTIMKYAEEKGELNVIYDQVGTPTYAYDLAGAILEIIRPVKKFSKPEIYHYSNEGVASWYDFAVSIVELAGIDCHIIPIEAKDYSLPAKRPHFSVMNKAKIKNDFNITIPYWRDSLKICIDKIKK